MNPVNFGIYTHRDVRESNYRLLDERTKFTVKIITILDAPGVDVWEGEGGYCPPALYEEEVMFKSKTLMNVRGARKQRAAKQYIPKELIKVVSMAQPIGKTVAMAIVTGQSDENIKIAELEARIKALLGIVRAPVVAAEKKAASLKKLEEVFEMKRTKA